MHARRTGAATPQRAVVGIQRGGSVRLRKNIDQGGTARTAPSGQSDAKTALARGKEDRPSLSWSRKAVWDAERTTVQWLNRSIVPTSTVLAGTAR